jgi:hypothetical protein
MAARSYTDEESVSRAKRTRGIMVKGLTVLDGHINQ